LNEYKLQKSVDRLPSGFGIAKTNGKSFPSLRIPLKTAKNPFGQDGQDGQDSKWPRRALSKYP
jgi:hypothetical protein